MHAPGGHFWTRGVGGQWRILAESSSTFTFPGVGIPRNASEYRSPAPCDGSCGFKGPMAPRQQREGAAALTQMRRRRPDQVARVRVHHSGF